jgi:hypothetical protein
MDAGGMAPLEWLENTLHLIRPHADARVGHLELCNPVAVTHIQARLAFCRIFDHVGEQIEQNLAQPALVGMHIVRQAGGEMM